MAWTQVYDPVGGAVVSYLYWQVSLISLFYMLAVRRAKGHYAAALAVTLSFVLAVAVWGMPLAARRHLLNCSCLRPLPHRLDRHHGGLGVQHDQWNRAGEYI